MRMTNSKTRQQRKVAFFLALAGAGVFGEARAINVDIAGGWPCNVWLNQPGVNGAVANFAGFNVKSTPSASSWSSGSVSGEVADYLSNLGKSFNASIGTLPLLEPLGFNLASENFGANFGVDVCIPVINATRDDPVDWEVIVTSIGPLIPPAEGDWFLQTTPKVQMQLLASNCNGAVNSPMTTSNPEKSGSCFIESVPVVGSDSLNFSGQSLTFKFKNMASREMALRFSLAEQSTAKRPWRLDAGAVNIDLIDDPLPPLLVGDLLGKQLFYAPDNDIVAWPGCANFTSASGIAFKTMNLQGPSSSLDLRWTGEDVDCTKQSGCADGNNGGNNFSFPVSVYLEDGSLANSGTPATAKVKNFIGNFSDSSFSGETQFPSDAKIEFLTEFDQVYRDGSKAFFSTTVSRLTGPGQFRSCRVWFKRDNGFSCASLPTPDLQNLCNSML